MKKIVSMLLCLLMVFGTCTAMAEAETDAVVLCAGEEYTMEISLSKGGGNAAMIGVDPGTAPITFVSAAGAGENDTVPPQSFDGYFVVINVPEITINPEGTAMSSSASTYTVAELTAGQIGTLTFAVKEDATPGTYEVKVERKAGSCTVEGSITLEITDAPPRKPGDVDENGEIDWDDLILVLKYVSFWPVEINLSNAEVTGDELVDWDDLIMILKYISGWPVELL